MSEIFFFQTIHIKYYFSINLKQVHTFTEHMLTIKIVLTFSMQAFVSRIGRFQPTSRDTNNNREMYDFWWTNKRS